MPLRFTTGLGCRDGDGSAVILIPGFMHSDVYLVVMYAWLKRLGYRPYYSGIDLNAECPDLLIKHQLNQLVDEAREETGREGPSHWTQPGRRHRAFAG